ncbi:hypothetical protein GL58_19255 [Comamonas testosteroni]|uniref:Calcineurin-like phosphoesterase domain-containing protein n=1 Tax=Comamonas testosteroni TaxID=285 RepID=A0A0L7MB96_COMTE|nr:phosphodiesterase [Comamonas testosteroni]KOC19159.1 hypothetical protein GL58_19255 [Comamonas testosteroni]KWT74728.1 3',5'-cyclic-nucleotide phosphodiesterase [Comamonas testosteroni]
MKLIHITDPHLVSQGEMLHGLNPYERLHLCVNDILAHHSDAAACVITGDLTHRGELVAYKALAKQLQRLPMPVYPLMGNHDRRDIFRSVFADGLDDGHGFVQGVMRHGGHSLVMLDTLSEGENGGRFDGPRPQWLTNILAGEAEAGQQVLLFLHHPPFPIGIPCLDRMSLFNPELLADVVDRHHHVQHMFFGHVHRPVCGNWRGISFSTMRGLNHQVPFDLSTVSPVPKSHEPPAYAVSWISKDTVVTHFHDFLGQGRMP